MPRNKSTRGERGKMDAINNEQDPKKRMKMIIDRKMNDTKVSNQLNDVKTPIFMQDYEQTFWKIQKSDY